MPYLNNAYLLRKLVSIVYVKFNSDCQDWWKSVRNEFFKVWQVCLMIPFQLTIKDRKLCKAVFIVNICHAKQGGS